MILAVKVSGNIEEALDSAIEMLAPLSKFGSVTVLNTIPAGISNEHREPKSDTRPKTDNEREMDWILGGM